MKFRLSPPGKALLAVAAGILLGSLFCNGPGREWTREVGIFSQSYREWLDRGEWELRSQFLKLLALRGGPVLVVLLSGRKRNICHDVLLFICSFCAAVFWSACLLIYGLQGIFFFLAVLFPHWLLYGIALGLMTASMASSWYRWHRILPVLASLLVLGAAAEACIHPSLVKWLFGLMP